MIGILNKRSSAQGNCSAKSLAGNVVDSSLSSLSSPRGGGLVGGGGSGGGGGGGQGTFHPPCYVLHYHMMLRPKGTSHNEQTFAATTAKFADSVV